MVAASVEQQQQIHPEPQTSSTFVVKHHDMHQDIDMDRAKQIIVEACENHNVFLVGFFSSELPKGDTFT